MTREEAIEINKNLKMYMKISDKQEPYKFLDENYIALDMAIEALKERPHGEWIYEYDDFYHCSICGNVICTHWDRLSLKKHFPFCHCGADMRKEGDDNGRKSDS